MIHELFPEHFPVQDQTRHAKRIAVERADHIICISEHTRQDLIRLLDIPPEKTTVVHLGFSFSLTNSNKIASSNITKPYILFVGVRSGYKNFARLLAAYASDSELSDAFDLVAFGGGKFSNEEQLLIRHHGLNQNQVHQVGGGDEALAALYKDAALFVYPSLYEGFGIPPLEAMSLDCPVACSNTSSIPEVVGEAAYLFDPHSSESISRAIQVVLGNAELRRNLQRQGQERVRSFSWQTCAAHTLDVYKATLS
jgi:glycosyltransferase involved in cell wall biosynthesis